MLNYKDVEDEKLQVLIKVAKRARRDLEVLNLLSGGNLNMTGYCGVGSRWLQRLAHKKGIDIDFIVGKYNDHIVSSDHCWVQYNGYIIDITATQFGFVDRIIVLKDNDFRYTCRLKNIKAIVAMKNWPHSQKFIKHNNKLKKIHINSFTKFKYLFEGYS